MQARAAVPGPSELLDKGCDLHPDGCLTCSLPRCRYDPGGVRQLLIHDRAKSVAQAAMTGASIPEICDRFQISRRTVFRDKALVRGAV